MNYFLYGSDTYRSKKKLHEIVGAYRARHGDAIDLHWLDAEDGDFSRVQEAGKTASLFSRKKMIVVERALSSGVAPEKLIAFLKGAKGSRDVIVVVWEADAGEKAKKQYAEVSAVVDKSQGFPLLAGAGLARWIREEAVRRGVSLSPADTAFLSRKEPDLWALAGEIEKIAVAGGAVRAPEGVRRASSVFDLGDTFFSSRRAALGHLVSLLDQGEDEMPIFSYLAGYCRTLLILKISAEQGEQVPAALGIHPFVVKKAARLAAGLERDALIKIFRRFFSEDVAIKTGSSKPQESLLSILFD